LSDLLEPSHRAASDDDARFTRVYTDTSRDILAFLLRRCPSPDDAADCLAETYRIAWEKRRQIPKGDGARPWLFGIARNVSRRERVSDERTASTTRELALAAIRSSAITATAPDDAPVIAALAELNQLDQEILMMLAWDGIPPREVASILGISPNAVRIRAHRARNKLRDLLRAPRDSSDNTGAPAAAR
jgi:RNA polymerase sigma-70 factor (ECF subfamily)